MLVAAIAGFATAVHTGNDWLGFVAGTLAGAALSPIFGVLTLWLKTNQYATGLALSLFGVGFSAFVGIAYTQEARRAGAPLAIPGLADLPFVGPAFFRQHPLVYRRRCCLFARSPGSSIARAPASSLRAVGESPESAHALGLSGARIRLPPSASAARCAASAGAYISVVYTPLWVEGMIAGKGWIALALTIFATWRPARVLLGAYLFGGVTMVQFQAQAGGIVRRRSSCRCCRTWRRSWCWR